MAAESSLTRDFLERTQPLITINVAVAVQVQSCVKKLRNCTLAQARRQVFDGNGTEPRKSHPVLWVEIAVALYKRERTEAFLKCHIA